MSPIYFVMDMPFFSLDKNFEYFLNTSFEQFNDGEWVAIYNNSVVSHGPELKKVIEAAKEKVPISKVLLSKVKKSASYL